MRADLFEDWTQANENWADSSIVINSRKSQTDKDRGVYTLMSREVPQLHIILANSTEINAVKRNNLISKKHCKDLMEKYHKNKDMVDSIVRQKEELALWQANPDYPDQRLYKCWQSTSSIKDSTTETSTTVETQRDITGADVQTMLSCP